LKKTILNISLFFLLSSGHLLGQCRTSVNVPDSVIYNVEKLSLSITQETKKEYEKACLIFQWVRSNIRYDTEAYRKGKKRINGNAADVLRRKEAVCQGYAQLYAELCQKAGLEAVMVDGHSKQGNIPPDMEEANHAWNAVKVDGEWFLLDVTWASDIEGQKYFFTPPEEFIKEHLPTDPMWQLLDNPVSTLQFKSGYLYTQKKDNVFNFNDSIDLLLNLPPAEQKIRTAENTFLFNATESNKKLLGQAYVDYAVSLTPIAEKLQLEGNGDSLYLVQEKMIKYFRLAKKQSPLFDWQKDNFANVLINQSVNISNGLINNKSFPEANEILQNMKKLLKEAKNMLKEGPKPNFPSQTLQVCEEYLKWVDSYWD
jgi:hypothetical protein